MALWHDASRTSSVFETLTQESGATPDEAMPWPTWLWDWAKQNALLTVGIIGTALSIFQGLEPFLELSRIAVLIMEHWRAALACWVWLGKLVGIEIPRNLAISVSIVLFVIAFFVRSYRTSRRTKLESGKFTLYVPFGIVSIFVCSVVWLFAPFSAKSPWFVLYYSTISLVGVSFAMMSMRVHFEAKMRVLILVFYLAVMLTPFTAVIFTDDPVILRLSVAAVMIVSFPVVLCISFVQLSLAAESETIRAFLWSSAKNVGIVTMLVFALVCANWIGVYAPWIAWKAKERMSVGSYKMCESGTLNGQATRVRGGDTIEVGGLPIRLSGIAVPELDEPGGEEPATWLTDQVEGKAVTCELNAEQSDDKCVAVCRLEGADIAAKLVAMGLARDCPRHSSGRYRRAEQQAVARGATIAQKYRLPEYCRVR